ncbi:MAG: hypothetical protein QG657_325 [Acidobacteriota bacterium]|nr:hypothetical protein [Acidobacteriota bacterium]
MSHGETKYEKVLELAKEALKKLNATTFENRKKADDIYQSIKKEHKEVVTEVPLENFRQYISAFTRDDNSPIAKKTGSNGYYIEIESSDTPKELSNEKIRLNQEKKLYPIVINWLKQKGFSVKDTSDKKIMGKWGNPDVTGIKVDEHFGKKEIEINTIEVKSTDANYEQLFFEAVSHRRWANRSYFAFAAPDGFQEKNNEVLRYYSELFHVGIIIIEMAKDDFDKFKDGKLDKKEEEILETAGVYELSSVLYESKPLKWQKQYLEGLGIKEEKDIYTWGNLE